MFVEGQDFSLLRRFAKKFGFENLADPQNTPIVRLGGFSEWRRAIHSTWALKEILDLEIQSICLFDRDYKSDQEVEEFELEIAQGNVKALVINRKEIENHLLYPDAIYSATLGRGIASKENLNITQFHELIDKTAESFRIDVFSQISAKEHTYRQKKNPQLDGSTVTKLILSEFEIAWRDKQRRLKILPGKRFLSTLNENLQQMSFRPVTSAMIIDKLDPAVVDSEWLSLLSTLNDFFSPE